LTKYLVQETGHFNKHYSTKSIQYVKSGGDNLFYMEMQVSWNATGDILLKYAAKVDNFGKIVHSLPIHEAKYYSIPIILQL